MITKLGRLCTPRVIHWLNALTNYLEVGRWFRERQLEPRYVCTSRDELYRAVGREIENKRVLYLEFGVWRGYSMRFWSALLLNPDSQLHGFDSFEGLPERWDISRGRGDFSTEGAIPQIADPRVAFHKGWFEETLPGFTLPPHDVLFVNIDCDLYSSTKTILKYLGPHIVPGTYLYFDEFADRWNELRAFEEFIEEHGLRFSAVAATPHLARVAFRTE